MTSMLLATPAWNRSRAGQLRDGRPHLQRDLVALLLLLLRHLAQFQIGARALGADAASGKQWHIQIETVSVRRDGRGRGQSLLRPVAIETQGRIAAFRSLLLLQLDLPLEIGRASYRER